MQFQNSISLRSELNPNCRAIYQDNPAEESVHAKKQQRSKVNPDVRQVRSAPQYHRGPLQPLFFVSPTVCPPVQIIYRQNNFTRAPLASSSRYRFGPSSLTSVSPSRSLKVKAPQSPCVFSRLSFPNSTCRARRGAVTQVDRNFTGLKVSAAISPVILLVFGRVGLP